MINKLSIPFVAAVPLSVLFTAALGLALYRFVLLRIRGLVISEVIATFGVGLAILELFRYLGFTGFEYTLPVFSDGSILIGNTYVDHQRVWIVVVGIVLALGLYLFTRYTKTGLAFRGIAQKREDSSLTWDQVRQDRGFQRGFRVGSCRGGGNTHFATRHYIGE